MQIIVNPEKREWAALTARPQMERSTIGPHVAAILDAVRAEGDDALLRLTREIDGVKLPSPAVTADEIEEASRLVPQELKTAIATAKNNIERFHAAQQGEGVDLETMPGVRCVQKAVPIRSVGLYIPGGSAPLFSTVLMLAIPARIAGCPQITLCSPPDKQGKLSPAILYTAQLCVVTHIFKAEHRRSQRWHTARKVFRKPTKFSVRATNTSPKRNSRSRSSPRSTCPQVRPKCW